MNIFRSLLLALVFLNAGDLGAMKRARDEEDESSKKLCPNNKETRLIAIFDKRKEEPNKNASNYLKTTFPQNVIDLKSLVRQRFSTGGCRVEIRQHNNPLNPLFLTVFYNHEVISLEQFTETTPSIHDPIVIIYPHIPDTKQVPISDNDDAMKL